MGRITQIKARKKRGSVEGFAYLYQSMLRYCENFNRSDVESICYDLYIAYVDTLRWEFPRTRFEEKRKKDFVVVLMDQTQFYQTSVQFYKSLEFVLNHINEACLKAQQLKTYQRMHRFSEEKWMLFYTLTGCSLRSNETVYHACAYSLLPSSNEPQRVFASGRSPWRMGV